MNCPRCGQAATPIPGDLDSAFRCTMERCRTRFVVTHQARLFDVPSQRVGPTPVPPVRDVFEGRALRDEGTDRVLGNAAADDGGAWLSAAWTAMEVLARTGRDFTADDLREMVGAPTRPNAMGSVFLKAKRRGMIAPVSRRQMKNPNSHARSTDVYRGTPISEWKVA